MKQLTDIHSRLEQLLLKVDKPARYSGGEFNTITKPDSEVDVRVALAFPDVYDIGMSYHGFKILYERLNAQPGVQAERVFAPWDDMAAVLRENDIPLYMLESRRPLRDADVVGFTLQHEMNYTNILEMLDLARIPIFAREREENDPIIIAGGHGAFNPEVLAEFIDAFVIGDGEQALYDLVEAVRSTRHNARTERLNALARIRGVYVPQFYKPRYGEDGAFQGMQVTAEGVPPVVRKSAFNLRKDPGCTRPVVPLLRVVHDRFAIEIKRGCTVGCRFCHAGMISRPVRERSPKQILEIAREGVRNTGYDEIALMSLSSADHSQILEVTRLLRGSFADENISVSLPSLRINAFDVDLADEIGSVRKSGFTFAPEAGTQRLRNVINKAVDEERYLETVEAVLRKGWRTLKLYFMCGLPTETDEDLQGIVDLTNKTIELGRKLCGGTFKLNLSISPFIPKPQTPFQWHAQPDMEEFERKYQYIESRVNRRFVAMKKHNVRESVIEGVLTRGDRRVGLAIHRAWQLGCKFDNWSGRLQFDTWQQAFAETGIDPHFFAHRERTKDEVFPWDHIDATLGKRFLWKEKTLGETAKTTDDCSKFDCKGCDACDDDVKNLLAIREDGEIFAPPAARKAEKPADPVQRFRFEFTKLGALRFISHLDLAKVMQLIFRRSGLEVAYSQGFNPQPRIQFTPPLPTGFASTGELMDVMFSKTYTTEEVIGALRSIELAGLEWRKVEEVPLRSPSLATLLIAADYELEILDADPDRAHTKSAVAQFAQATEYPVQIEQKGKPVTKDLARAMKSFEISEADETVLLKVRVSLADGEYVNPVKGASSILDLAPEAFKATRTGFVLATAAN